MNEDYRPKLSILLTDEQRMKLNKLLPWGTGSLLFGAIIDELIVLLEEHGPAIIGLIVGKKVSMIDLMKINEQRRGAKNGSIQSEARPRRPRQKRANEENSGD